MRLTELKAVFVQHHRTHLGRTSKVVSSIGKATGVRFLCPKCLVKNGTAAGTHQVICWSPGVPADLSPGPGRWSMLGTGLHDLTLKGAHSSSVHIHGGCGWHGSVENGATRDV